MADKENENADAAGFHIDPKGKHELGREINIDYRGFLRLKERLTKGKPRKRDRMY